MLDCGLTAVHIWLTFMAALNMVRRHLRLKSKGCSGSFKVPLLSRNPQKNMWRALHKSCSSWDKEQTAQKVNTSHHHIMPYYMFNAFYFTKNIIHHLDIVRRSLAVGGSFKPRTLLTIKKKKKKSSHYNSSPVLTKLNCNNSCHNCSMQSILLKSIRLAL